MSPGAGQQRTGLISELHSVEGGVRSGAGHPGPLTLVLGPATDSMDVITTHINADFDCLGSMIAARRLYPEAELVFAGAQEKGLREFFVKSTVYAYGFKRIRDIDLDAITRLILVDVRQSERIGPFGAVARRPEVAVHIYDHHPAGHADLHGELETIEAVGATVTIMAELFRERGIVPSADEATMMMLGLYEDTGSLRFNSTTVRDLQAAAFLLEHGANLNTVSDFLTQELTAEQVALLHELIQSRTVLNVNGIDISIAHAVSDRFVGDLAVLAHKLKDMENLDALLVAVVMGDRVFLVGRSRIPEVHVGEILGEFGGGGHAFAASGTVRDMTLLQVLDRFPQILASHVTPRWEARQLMSRPVKTAAVTASVDQVREILTRYNLNAMPVLSGEQVAGLVTRQTVDKAAHHGLGQSPIRDYMSTEFVAVGPDAAPELLRELIVERNQRLVPVIDAGCLAGVITRTDLMRQLASGGRFAARPGLSGGGAVGLKRRQVLRLLREQLPTEIQTVLKDLGEVGDDLGCSVFAVGGFVRDLLLRQENLDIDVVVEGDGIAFAQAFAQRFQCRVRSHPKFGTAVIVFPDGFKIDVASARLEYYLEPGALPHVEHASIRLDLARRDFTINTLALALNTEVFSDLLDFFQAQSDLQEKAIRVLHNLSFVEDPTRVFRAIRFEQRLGFHLGRHTEQLLQSAVRMGFLDKVGGTRVFNELVIILRETNPLPAVQRLAEFDLLKYLHPGLTLDARSWTRFEDASRALHWFELLFTGETCQRWLVYFLCLTAALDSAAMADICDRLTVPTRYRQLLVEERQAGLTALRELERRRARHRPPRPSEIYHLLNPLASEIQLFLMALAGNEAVRRWISQYVTQLRTVTSFLTGKDLAELGLPPGPRYRTALAALLEARLDGRVATREDEVALVRQRFLNPGPG